MTSPSETPARGADRRVPKKGRVRQRDQERAPIDPSALIVTRRLSKRYDSLIAVDHLDIEVRAGEIFGLLGQNGAGKTTTILMLLGLTEPSSGGARVAGFDPARNPIEVKRRVGYLPDAVGFYDNMTGRQNLRYTAKLNGLFGAEAEAKISEAIEHVGMTSRADTKVETYSRGMKQRLGIADALVKDPEILILDEPTTAIDPIGVIEILDMLRRLVRERGLAVLLSSHLLAQVQSVCDRVGIFAAGKLIGVGTVAELAEQFGFAANNIELVIDAPADQDEAIAKALRAVPGVTDAKRQQANGSQDLSDNSEVAEARRKLQRSQKLQVGAMAVLSPSAALGTAIRTSREIAEFDSVAATNPVPAYGPAERIWIVTFDSDRAVHDMISAIVLALAEFPLVRIGRAEPSLDDIYRDAVRAQGLAPERGAA